VEAFSHQTIREINWGSASTTPLSLSPSGGLTVARNDGMDFYPVVTTPFNGLSAYHLSAYHDDTLGSIRLDPQIAARPLRLGCGAGLLCPECQWLLATIL